MRARINYRLRQWFSFLPSHLMQLCQFSGNFESLPKPAPIELSRDSCSALNQNAQGSSNILYGAESRFASINFPHSNAMFARWWQSPFLKSTWDFSDAVVQPEREEKSRKSPLKIFCFSGLIFSTLATMKSSFFFAFPLISILFTFWLLTSKKKRSIDVAKTKWWWSAERMCPLMAANSESQTQLPPGLVFIQRPKIFRSFLSPSERHQIGMFHSWMLRKNREARWGKTCNERLKSEIKSSRSFVHSSANTKPR